MPRASVLRAAVPKDAVARAIPALRSPEGGDTVASAEPAGKAKIAKVSVVDSLALAVPKPSPSYEEILELQDELYAGFSDPDFQRELRAVEQRHGKAHQRLTPEHTALFLSVQDRILPKYGFAKGQRGVLQMLQESSRFNEDEVFRENREVLNGLLGLSRCPVEEQSWRTDLAAQRNKATANGALVPFEKPTANGTVVPFTLLREARRGPPLVTERLVYTAHSLWQSSQPQTVLGIPDPKDEKPGPRLLAICDASSKDGVLAVPRSLSAGRSPPFGPCWIVGSWDDFQAPIEMEWDGRGAFRVTVEAGADSEAFQILVGDTSFRKRIVPSIPGASPWVPHKAVGPLGGVDLDGRDWVIGADFRDKCAYGACYDIILRCPKTRPISVSWAEAGSPYIPRT